jgi:hypothetical protein
MSAMSDTMRELAQVYAKHGRMPDAHYVSIETLCEIKQEAEAMQLVHDPKLVGGQMKLMGVPLKVYTTP